MKDHFWSAVWWLWLKRDDWRYRRMMREHWISSQDWERLK